MSLPRCTHCGKAGAKNVCGACSFTPYCSERCAGLDWPLHCEADEQTNVLALENAVAPLNLVWDSDGVSIWLGGLPALEHLDDNHIDAVVTVLPKDSRNFDPAWLKQCIGPRRDHLWLDYRDSPDAQLHKSFAMATTWIHRRKRVLVHCVAGMSRSATIVAAYILRYHGKQFDSVASVILYLQQRRSIVAPNPGFLQQLEGWR